MLQLWLQQYSLSAGIVKTAPTSSRANVASLASSFGMPLHHRAGMPKQEASDATFARLLVGAVFTMPAEGGAGLPSANVSSAILRAAGGGLGANGFAALVARAQSLPLQRVALSARSRLWADQRERGGTS
ncbi:MAG: hypothetical protein DMD82_08360 [Candidatus Rokuibacteriota bacterium]|nr:MAG: hypothetical protein DMD82_08360 [Candidatus Rokubacteria bacterium]